jgi:Asp-tRNA(Asn)/Glu-tRNA(Gln) amidotransferase A subunit family amidase
MRIELNSAPAAEIAAAVQAGDVRPADVVEAALAAIGTRDPVLNSFTAVTGERARARAQAIDAARTQGQPLGPLAGVPFAVKNLFDIEGLPTLAGAKINRTRPPAPRDAALIERLEAAGAILVGALNMGEYAYDFTGENIHDGASRNPHDVSRMTGGSSGGSAGAVAGRLVPLSLGSDTNGSIRVPSSLCGLFGLKPTYGPTTPCRVPIRMTRPARTAPPRRRCRSSSEALKASPSRWPAATSGKARDRRLQSLSIGWPRRCTPTARSIFRKPRGRARPPM